MARKLYGSPFAIVETVLRVRPRIAVGSLRRLLETAASLGMLGVLAGHFFCFLVLRRSRSVARSST